MQLTDKKPLGQVRDAIRLPCYRVHWCSPHARQASANSHRLHLSRGTT